MIKVLFVNNCLTGGGSERAMCLIANYFSQKGLDVSMMLLVEKEKTYYIDPAVKIIECYYPLIKNKVKWHINRILTIREVIKKEKPDIVVSFMTDVNIRVNLAALGLNTYVIQSERADPNQNKTILKTIATNVILTMADFTVFQTLSAQKAYPKSIQRKSVVIPNAININLPTTDRSKVRNYVVSIGRLTEQKNYVLLIDAFECFYKVHKDFKLVIYGEGPLRRMLEERVCDKKLEDVVSFPGYSLSINDDIKDAFMYVNSSDYEGISNAMLEALALGIPSICTDCPVGGASMVIKDGINGLLVPPNDLEAMVFAMTKVADDIDFSNKLSMNAVNVRQDYSIESIGEQWINICDLKKEKIL